MTTQDSRIGRDYHQRTKLGPADAAPRRVDAALVPRPYKVYRTVLPATALPAPAPDAGPPDALAALLRPAIAPDAPLTVAGVTRIVHYSAGITRRSLIGGSDRVFRAASCTGSAYHIETYLVCGDLAGLPAGVYHYGVHDSTLRRLRTGDFRGALARACADQRAGRALAVLVYTSEFWRNAWRYQERAYRHAFWDCGTIAANAGAVAHAQGLETQTFSGFVDDAVNRLIGVDGVREAALAVEVIGSSAAAPPGEQVIDALNLEVEPVSRVTLEYPAIDRMHAAGGLAASTDVAGCRSEVSGSPGRALVFAPGACPESIEQVIMRRGSARRFSAQPLSQDQLAVLTHVALEDGAVDIPSGIQASLVVQAAAGLEPGVYRAAPNTGALTRVAQSARSRSQQAALGQAAAGEAAVNIYFWCTQQAVWGGAWANRTYRAAQLQAGIRGGRLYLASHALGLSATGLTFCDDVAADMLGLPDGAVVLFLMAVGHRVERR